MQSYRIKMVSIRSSYANTDASNYDTTSVTNSNASEGTGQLVSRVKQALPQLDSDAKHQKSRSLTSMEMNLFFTSMIPV